MKPTYRVKMILLSLAFLVAASTGNSWALTAANTRIVNNASLSYNDGTGTQTVFAIPVTVTVSLIPGMPTVSAGPNQQGPYTGVDTQLINTFTITASNTNGPDTYSLTPAIVGTPDNTTGYSLSLTSPASPVTLGGTVSLTGSTDTVLNVPSDGVSNGRVNEIAVGDWIVVDNDTANPRQVTAVNDAPSATATITVNPGFPAAPAAGVLVAEQQTVTVTVRSGTITTIGQSIVITKNLTVASTTDPAMTATSADITDSFTSGTAALTKYVRNISQPAMTGSGATTSYNSATYYAAGITARPGETLEYILVALNSGSGDVTSSVITDAIPTAYVTLVQNAYSGSYAVTYVNETGGTSTYTATGADDQATFTSPNLNVNVGTGATIAAGGTIASGATVRVLYQVTVNP